MTITTADPVGIVGVGAMGLPIVRYLTQAGFKVLCWDLDEGRLSDAVADGGEAVASSAELGACRALLVLVPADEDVCSVRTSSKPSRSPAPSL
ncbi:NAD(P)-binding domain-containing protein [Streptomyces sp. NPDC059909]|uniref:NAD(P)-binding domain-containing protein n=1 Tax=Streptomyces sp. NPDC059909 TaxID=3346998 RepID=UPI0036526F5E